jgi:SAM-dependent methyltransferase
MVDKQTIRRGYEDLGPTYATERPADGVGSDMLDWLLERVPASAAVLDAGCGPGSPVLDRLSTETSATGLDFARQQITLARANAPAATLVQGDLTTLPFAGGVFDAVVASHSLIHVPLDDHQAVIDEFARVLAHDGYALLTEGPEEWTGTNPDWLDSGVEMQWNIAGADATREQLRTAGFTIIDESVPTGAAAAEQEHWVALAGRLDR